MSAALLNGVNKAMVAVVAVVTVLADLSLTRIEMENLVFRSIIVTSALLCPSPITKSIAQSPTLLLLSTTCGRPSILIRFLINPLAACLSFLHKCLSK
jgi:hypothetical protein